MRKRKPARSYVFKVSLRDRPGTWRRIVMRGDQTLHHLHEEIFGAFGRDDEHLYSFYFPVPGARGRGRLRDAEESSHPMALGDGLFDDERSDASKTRLDSLDLEVGQRFDYLFDFGDSWWHDIVIEEIRPAGVPPPMASWTGAGLPLRSTPCSTTSNP